LHIPCRRTTVLASTDPASTDQPARQRGQSLVEMALIVPIVAFLLLGIYDFSRVFTSMLAIESAAREAADYGAWRSANWNDLSVAATLNGMESRACLASRNLPDYDGLDTSCDNPAMTVDLIDQDDASAFDPKTLTVSSGCELETRIEDDVDLGPCDVRVDLTYTFDLIIPLGFDAFGTRFGLPQDVTFTRTSIFAISDFTIDQ
jgi:TadE-like protein